MIDHNFVVPKPKKGGPTDDDPLEKPRLMMVVGGTGSGKTTCVANLLMALDKKFDWDTSLYISGNGQDEFLKTLEMDVSTSPNDLDDFITKVMQPSDEPKYNLIVLDDLQGNVDFNIFLGRSNFAKFVTSHRHLGKVQGEGGTWIVATAQTLKSSFTTTFRKNVNLYFVFPPRDEDETRIVEGVSGDRSKMKKALAMARLKSKHEFVFVNKVDVTDVKYFLGFKEELHLC